MSTLEMDIIKYAAAAMTALAISLDFQKTGTVPVKASDESMARARELVDAIMEDWQ